MKNTIKLIMFLFVSICNAQIPEYIEERITATDSYLGKKSSVTLIIDDANGDNEITNPLIVVEGFDVGVLLSPESKYGNTSYDDFQRTLDLSYSNSLKKIVYNQNKQYDIIYI
ncbi:hypothetical protein [Tenacibaculum maritimum]|nr:hypothetical protein [Tenacibaculum maritimum]